MIGLDLKKVCYWISFVQFKIGNFFFPVLEPFFQWRENFNSGVKNHFFQAMAALEQNNFSVALLNLNMVLSLHPEHFLARIYRGRVFLQEGRYRLASEDYIEANQINRYRFLHYDLYREYLQSVNRRLGDAESPAVENFDPVFEIFRPCQESEGQEIDKIEAPESFEDLGFPNTDVLEGDDPFEKYEQIGPEEKARFEGIGPITRKEIEATDWDELTNQLRS